MLALESRFYKPNDIIYDELDDALEILFVMSGTYNVGYNLNK